MSKGFENKVAIVTGGSRGIGSRIVAMLCDRGARVYFTYHRHEEEAVGVEKEYPAHKILCPQGDMSSIERSVDTVVKQSGGIDILVNNAGITSDQYLMMMPDESWQKVLDTNLSGAFRWAKMVSRPMLSAQSGVIINIASVSGLVGIAGQSNYAASKGALLAFSRSLAAELGPRGVRVNAVVPGFIDTDMTARMQRDIKKQNIKRILLQRFGTADEVANAVLFLASEESSYIVGQALIVDGGLTSTVA
ncbi:MAG: glucose 1-dehydrogenase [Chitinivibrionales bacterium]|nr:glucose 1-dehydrogenase [Chitinivibrionales bacterium]